MRHADEIFAEAWGDGWEDWLDVHEEVKGFKGIVGDFHPGGLCMLPRNTPDDYVEYVCKKGGSWRPPGRDWPDEIFAAELRRLGARATQSQ